jgi:predicted phosphodiesterase
VLVGDIFELLLFDYNKITECHHKLMHCLSKLDFVIVRGNHDLSHLVPNRYRFEDNGYKFVFEHGHLSEFTWRHSRVHWAVGKFLEASLLISPKTTHLLYRLFRTKCKIRKPNKELARHYAVRLWNDYDVVVLGHSHHLDRLNGGKNNKKFYFNCGASDDCNLRGVVFDTKYPQDNILIG